MKTLWIQVDELLRHRKSITTVDALDKLKVRDLIVATVVLGAVYGLFMGWYAVCSRAEPEYRQLLANLWKVPGLFLITLCVCCPSLYVFGALNHSRLSLGQMVRLVMAVTAIAVTVLASLGPIVAFFSLSTENYVFMKLLNIACFSVAGWLGLKAFRHATRMLLASPPPLLVCYTGTQEGADAAERLAEVRQRREETSVRRLFQLWMFIVIVVGAQMGWVLRPFILDPQTSFVWFSHRDQNFLVDWIHTVRLLFG